MAGLSAVVLDAQQLAAPGHAVGADAALALIDFVLYGIVVE